MSWEDLRSLYTRDWPKLSLLAKKRDNYTCQHCKKKYPANSQWLHVHHKVPLSRGGTNELINLETLCYNCHKILHPHMGETKSKVFPKPRFSKVF